MAVDVAGGRVEGAPSFVLFAEWRHSSDPNAGGQATRSEERSAAKNGVGTGRVIGLRTLWPPSASSRRHDIAAADRGSGLCCAALLCSALLRHSREAARPRPPVIIPSCAAVAACTRIDSPSPLTAATLLLDSALRARATDSPHAQPAAERGRRAADFKRLEARVTRPAQHSDDSDARTQPASQPQPSSASATSHPLHTHHRAAHHSASCCLAHRHLTHSLPAAFASPVAPSASPPPSVRRHVAGRHHRASVGPCQRCAIRT